MSRRIAAFLAAAGLAVSLGLVASGQAPTGRASDTYLQVGVGVAAGHIDVLRPRGFGGDDQPGTARPSRLGQAGPFGGLGAALPQNGIQYNGGAVIQAAKVVAVYWGSTAIYSGGPTPGTSGPAASDGSLIGYYLRNLGGSPYYNINTSYTNSSGTPIQNNPNMYTAFWADNNSVPTGCAKVTDAQMRTQLINGFNTGALTYDSSTIYAIFTAGQVNLGGGFGNCNGNNFQYCAYHTNFSWNGNVVKYAAMPYNYTYQGSCTAFQGGGPAHGITDPGADAEVNTLTHEIEEANTDPQLNAWWVSNSSSQYYQEENADMCAWTFGALNVDGKGNITVGGQSWLVQRNWLNTAPSGGCAQSYGAAPTTGAISGKVTSSSGGAGISGATVSITGASTTTDGGGNYTLTNVALGTYTVFASAAGYQNSSVNGVTVSAGNATVANLTLTPTAPMTGTITGRITSSVGGSGISGATVSAAGHSTNTDAIGSYTLTNVAPGTYSVSASAIGYQNNIAAGISVSAGTTSTANVTLAPNAPTTGAISGKVTSSAGGAGIAGANVSVSSSSTTTDGGGNYTLTNIAPGTYTVSASATGYQTGSVAGIGVSGGATTLGVNIVLTPTTGAISGRITNAGGGLGISGATVSIPGQTTSTDGSGNYSLTNVAPGTYTLSASATGFASGSLNGVSVSAGITTLNANIALAANAGGVPGAPTLTAATRSGFQHGVLLSWSTPANNGSAITSYQIWRSTSSGAETLIATVGSVNSYTDTGTSSFRISYYKVKAVSAAGPGPFSNEASAFSW